MMPLLGTGGGRFATYGRDAVHMCGAALQVQNHHEVRDVRVFWLDIFRSVVESLLLLLLWHSQRNSVTEGFNN